MEKPETRESDPKHLLKDVFACAPDITSAMTNNFRAQITEALGLIFAAVWYGAMSFSGEVEKPLVIQAPGQFRNWQAA